MQVYALGLYRFGNCKQIVANHSDVSLRPWWWCAQAFRAWDPSLKWWSSTNPPAKFISLAKEATRAFDFPSASFTKAIISAILSIRPGRFCTNRSPVQICSKVNCTPKRQVGCKNLQPSCPAPHASSLKHSERRQLSSTSELLGVALQKTR